MAGDRWLIRGLCRLLGVRRLIISGVIWAGGDVRRKRNVANFRIMWRVLGSRLDKIAFPLAGDSHWISLRHCCLLWCVESENFSGEAKKILLRPTQQKPIFRIALARLAYR